MQQEYDQSQDRPIRILSGPLVLPSSEDNVEVRGTNTASLALKPAIVLQVSQLAMEQAISAAKSPPRLKAILNSPASKAAIGLAVGIGFLFLVARYVNISTTISIVRTHLTTPQGIIYALLCGLAFLAAFSIRGVRWKLFLNPIGNVSTAKAVQLFLVGMFLNFLLPIRGGEVAKSLMLKRVANIPVSQSLPTVAMDKALDLLPALIIMAIVPLLGVKIDRLHWPGRLEAQCRYCTLAKNDARTSKDTGEQDRRLCDQFCRCTAGRRKPA